MSFGGEAGKEMANVIDDADALEAAYQKVIDQYNSRGWISTWKATISTRAKQTASGATPSSRGCKRKSGADYFLYAAGESGRIVRGFRALLADAKAKGVKVHSANIMVMFFGKRFINKGKSESELGIESANAAYAQIQKVDPAMQIGLCPCLGRNGSGDEFLASKTPKR